ncbi:MAG: Na/Pi symporter [Thermoplasmatota archaeon]
MSRKLLVDDRGKSKDPVHVQRSRAWGRIRGLNNNQWFNLLVFFLAIYFFIIGIKLMGSGFKGFNELFGSGDSTFADILIGTVSNPLVGLCVGVFVTAVIQSSSATTATVVAIVAVEPSFFPYAIPIVIGANIGTSVTNIIVSLGHIAHPPSFKRAFAGALVHDFFNVLAASLIFPMELLVKELTGKGFLERAGDMTAGLFLGETGAELELIDRVLGPVLDPLRDGIRSIDLFLSWQYYMIIVGAVILFIALNFITRAARKAIDGKVQKVVDRVLFRNAPTSFLFGAGLTSFVQSSSVTTSLAIPMVGGGILSIRQIYPYTLGANIGTTVTALLAAMAAQSTGVGAGGRMALAISFVHLYFNISGILIFYPLKKVPIYLANTVAGFMANNRKLAILFLLVVFFLIPGSIILIDRFLF